MDHTDAVLTPRAEAMLHLVMLPGLGSVRASRLLDAFGGSADRVLGASHAAWCAVPGIGRVTSEKARAAIPSIHAAVAEERERMHASGVRGVALGDPGYPALLTELPDAPRVLFFRGEMGPTEQDPVRDAYPLAVVGSRRCTQYGIEQAERFAGVLGRSGLTIVSGGARGIDTAAHRGTLRSGGRTIIVLGCGLGRVYPPENHDLFERVITERAGAIVSELPMLTEPRGEHFPARNRIISGLSLGVLVIEAGRKSGALITAAMAAEDHGREVMILPGRVDAESIAGSLDLLKRGCGAMVTEPGDVLDLLESPARFAHQGVHADRYADPARAPMVEVDDPETTATSNRASQDGNPDDLPDGPPSASPNDDAQILAALRRDRAGLTFDTLLGNLQWEASRLRTGLTMLELSGRVRRNGSLFSAFVG